MTIIRRETIIAECSPKGRGAVSLLRLSGPDALSIADHLVVLSPAATLQVLPTHTIHYGWIVDQQGQRVDQVLLLLMKAPKTFTGEDTIEITCHGNPFIVQEIIALAITHGARLAQPGEFTQRAVMHDKIDLVQAEAIHDIVTANTQVALKQSLSQLHGSLSHVLNALEHDLLSALALSDASFEFIDEDEEFGTQVLNYITKVANAIAHALACTGNTKIIKQGVRIALIGSVNTGKSSLFNALLSTNRSIVTDQAGTTRDTIEALLEKSGTFITLIDTAGLRFTHDRIEQEGIERSRNEAHAADIILLIYDGTRELNAYERTVYQEIEQTYAHKILSVTTKKDLLVNKSDRLSPHESIGVSSHTQEGIDGLHAHITQKIDLLVKAGNAPFLLNERQHLLLTTLAQDLTHITSLLHRRPVAYELVSYHLRDALAHVSSLTGKTVSEQSMDLIFRQFCIGK